MVKRGDEVTDGLLTGTVVIPKMYMDNECRTVIQMSRTNVRIDLDYHSLTILSVSDDSEEYDWSAIDAENARI